MAYATDNPIKKVAQMSGNSLWFYTDGDATSSIVGSGYFNSAYAELKQGDMILVAAGVGGTMESDLIVVSSATGVNASSGFVNFKIIFCLLSQPLFCIKKDIENVLSFKTESGWTISISIPPSCDNFTVSE